MEEVQELIDLYIERIKKLQELGLEYEKDNEEEQFQRVLVKIGCYNGFVIDLKHTYLNIQSKCKK